MDNSCKHGLVQTSTKTNLTFKLLCKIFQMNPTFQESTFCIELKVSFKKNQIKLTQVWRLRKHNLDTVPDIQSMSCEGACAHAHVQCAVAGVCVRAKSILKSVRNVRACGPFLCVRCEIPLLHTFWNKIARNCYFLS